MAKATVKLVKKSSSSKKATKFTPGAVATDFQFVDNGDSTCTVNGVDGAGNPVDISTVATITASSSDTTLVTVDAPSGMTFGMHAVGPLSTPGTPVAIAVVATWTDGSKGPFSFTLNVDVIAGGPTGIIVVPGTVTTH
jgi:hypothetical protein